jgi:hypothetical protein
MSKTIDFNDYIQLLEKHSLPYFKDELQKMIKLAKEEFFYLNVTNLREIKKLKNEWTKNLQ